jgi:hypothetical protein
MSMRIVASIAVVLLLFLEGKGQAPFALDPSFQTQIQVQYVSSIAPLEDGSILVSGRMRFPGDIYDRLVSKLFSNGLRDPSFPQFQGGYIDGGGKLTLWNGRFYVATNTAIRRYWFNGSNDPGFIHPDLGPYFSSLQGGDYHVFPDGRVVMSGVHLLEDSIRGYMGYHNFIWFSNTGHLDTTRVHRWGDGAIFRFKELPDGKFICSGTNTTFESQPVDKIFRLHADGSLDDSFSTGVFAGMGFAYLPLENGKVIVGGNFRTAQLPSDTIRLAKFLEDGTLDPSFNIPDISFNTLPDLTGLGPSIDGIEPLQDGSFFVMGQFDHVNGQPRRGICVLDANGNLMWPFHDEGVNPYTYMGWTYAAVHGILPSPDSAHYYIWGAYHGYDDPTGSFPQQRFVSRLHAGDLVTAAAEQVPASQRMIRLFPNPASAWVAVNYDLVQAGAERTWLRLKDALGRVVHTVHVKDSKGQVVLDTRAYGAGVYTVELVRSERVLQVERLVLQ